LIIVALMLNHVFLCLESSQLRGQSRKITIPNQIFVVNFP
jgi:hypothetical protein